MSDVAIRVEGLGKQYQIGARQVNKNVREGLTDLMAWPVRAGQALLHRGERAAAASEANTLWALRDVCFEVRHGEVVGIIGRNGAGKSTLLKILARITKPSEGYADIFGRVGSLLEVGTGFHPELTGRENILLNGAIMGMHRSEILGKFDEIVAFAEVDRFIDTPVKHYSSGMYVRLAFAVAAHLEPEILFVDEVLAVGDTAFQKKCLGKMRDVAQGGRTVVFVSHSMQAIRHLCNRALLFAAGELRFDGPAGDVIDQYLLTNNPQGAEVTWPMASAPGTETVKVLAIRVKSPNGLPGVEYGVDQSIALEIEFVCRANSRRLNPAFHIYNSQGVIVFGTANMHDPIWGRREYGPGAYRMTCIIPGNFLNRGHYLVTAMLTRDLLWHEAFLSDILSFEVIDTGEGTDRGDYIGDWVGLLRVTLPWTGAEILGAQA